jgi:hypothetical protein
LVVRIDLVLETCCGVVEDFVVGQPAVSDYRVSFKRGIRLMSFPIANVPDRESVRRRLAPHGAGVQRVPSVSRRVMFSLISP